MIIISNTQMFTTPFRRGNGSSLAKSILFAFSMLIAASTIYVAKDVYVLRSDAFKLRNELSKNSPDIENLVKLNFLDESKINDGGTTVATTEVKSPLNDEREFRLTHVLSGAITQEGLITAQSAFSFENPTYQSGTMDAGFSYVTNGLYNSVQTIVPSGGFTLSSNSLYVGQTTSVSDDCLSHPSSYASSNESVATVSGTVITAVSAGTSNISQIGGTCSDASPKTITVLGSSGTFTLSSNSITIGGESDISSNCSISPDSYVSSDSGVASVSGTKITGVSVGTATIAPLGGLCSDTAPKTVTVSAVGTFALSTSSTTIGGTGSITNDCSVDPTSYASSNESVATISGNVITGISPGTTSVTQIGGTCADSSSKTFTVNISAPTGLAVSSYSTSSSNPTGQTAFYITWNSVVGASTYKVYRNGTLLPNTNSGMTELGATGLTAGTTYSMTVKAVSSAGLESVASSPLSVTTLASNVLTFAPSGGTSSFTNLTGMAGTVFTKTGTITNNLPAAVTLYFNNSGNFSWTQNGSAVTSKTLASGETTQVAFAVVAPGALGTTCYDFSTSVKDSVPNSKPNGTFTDPKVVLPGQTCILVTSTPPNSEFIVYAGTSSYLFKKNFGDTGAGTQITTAQAWSPAYSPDGQSIVYVNPGDDRLYKKSSSDTSNGSAITPSGVIARTPTYSPDGAYVTYTNLSDAGKLYKKSPNDALVGTAITTAAGNQPTYSPDGAYIVYANASDGSKLYKKASGDATDGSAINAVNSAYPSYSYDGSQIVYTNMAVSKRVYKKSSGDTADGSAITTAEGYYPKFSPDGLYVIYQNRWDVSNLYKKNAGDASNGTAITSASSSWPILSPVIP